MKKLSDLHTEIVAESTASDYVTLFKKFYENDDIKVKLKKDGVEVTQGDGTKQFFEFDGFLKKLAKDSADRLPQKQWTKIWAIANKLGHT